MRHARARTRTVARRVVLSAAAGLACLIASTAPRAEPVSAVVEMFTSQGCTACRAAEPVMRDLARKPGVIALTLPVTYWDYLGWHDTLGLRALNERQRAYARARGARQVVTPQAIVDGGPTAIGSNRPAIERLLSEVDRATLLPVPVSAEVQGNRIVVEVGVRGGPAKPDPKPEGKDDVWLVPLLKRRETEVGAGENGGRVATYVNVVRGLQRLGSWTGQPVRFEVPASAAAVSEADGWVVLVQHAREGRLGHIIGAAKGPGL
ncbi:DUF1223 domain-containing protein [Methylobacterium sp. J-076]|uniref:DUF1223 domain-containing protein n=1 Tax=Methylobacterium sp. J-076 TaxID=2836655 RepID=UPI001FBB6807|nr:DUF1223 domain-containing protein [Methylobacterium sp. J-076]MCJ2014225.1 DUF1223 domain-containing protein [Methylobacterium sp. J-076]